MSGINLASDNATGASERVIAAIAGANGGAQAAYGADDYSLRAERLIGEIFECAAKVQLVATGTAANALALASVTPPWGAVLCHAEAHVMDDECGAPEFFTHGAKLVGIPGAGGKITPDGLRETLTRFPRGAAKSVQPTVLSLSQVTEAGTLYALDEIRALADLAHAEGLKVHMDGARFANAAISLGVSPAALSWQAGVDVLSLGLTKTGALACEAVIFFDEALHQDMPYRRKRSGHTLSKGRLLGAQAVALLEDGHWLELAAHANAMAARLSQGLAALPGVRLAWPTQANEVFSILPARIDDALRQAGYSYYAWSSGALMPGERVGEDERFVRMVASFETKPEGVDALLAAAKAAV
jgi:threonine aldolase